MIGATEAEETAILLFLGWLGQPGAGLQTIYWALEYLADRYGLADVTMVVECDLTGPQIFRSDYRPLDVELASQVLAKGPGIYTEPDAVPAVLREVVLALAPVAIALEVGADRANLELSAPKRQSFEDAVSVATANGSRYGWSSTVVVLEVGGERREAAHSNGSGHTVAEHVLDRVERALQQVLRMGDAAGRVGATRFGALLANARTDEAGAFLSRLRAELGLELADLPISIGAASAPDDSVDPEELLRLAVERIG